MWLKLLIISTRFAQNIFESSFNHVLYQSLMQRRYWTIEEDRALKEIVESMTKVQWSAVAERMRQSNSFCERNSKQCRERWLNKHKIQHFGDSQWHITEDEIILQQFLKMERKQKNKWILISDSLACHKVMDEQQCKRTPNEIKNRFYSIFRKGVRRINNRLGGPILSQEIRLIKPITLSKMFEQYQQNEATQYLRIIFNMANQIPQLTQFSQEMSRQKLESVLAIVMELDRNQQRFKLKNETIPLEKIKKRKSSLSTVQQQKYWNTLSGNYESDQKNIMQYKDDQKDYVGLFITNFVDEEQSLQFQEMDFGLWKRKSSQ